MTEGSFFKSKIKKTGKFLWNGLEKSAIVRYFIFMDKPEWRNGRRARLKIWFQQ